MVFSLAIPGEDHRILKSLFASTTCRSQQVADVSTDEGSLRVACVLRAKTMVAAPSTCWCGDVTDSELDWTRRLERAAVVHVFRELPALQPTFLGDVSHFQMTKLQQQQRCALSSLCVEAKIEPENKIISL